MPAPAPDIRPAEVPRHLDIVRGLFRDYVEALGVSLDFQDFDAELVDLPGDYAPPQGRLLLAWQSDQPVGCVALRPLEQGICEMKRLYLKPSARASGLGKRLALRICDEARAAGYTHMRLDTLSTMTSALRLYESLGFKAIAPYCYNPLPGAVYLELDLCANAS
jgi:ribosomal protein S18 acetylase RimI-like enzyme